MAMNIVTGRVTRAVLAISAIVVFFSADVNAVSTVKDGQSCAARELGQTRNGLSCIKEGSRRVWRRVSAAAPQTTAVSARNAKQPIKIGVVLSLSDAKSSLVAEDQLLGAKIAEEYFNANGGVNGRAIKLVVQDSGADDEGAVRAFTSLIKNENVIGIVGPTLSRQALAADPIADRARVPVIGSSNTAPNIAEIGTFVSRVSPSLAAYGGKVIQFAAALQPTAKVAVFVAEGDAFAQAESLVFQQAIRSLGIELLRPQMFSSIATAAYADQLSFVTSNRPDLVVVSGPSLAANLVKQLRDSGYNGTIIGGAGLNVVQTFSICKAQCDGLILIQAYSPEIPADGVNAELRKVFKRDHQREPNQISAQAFTAVQVFVEALRVTDKSGKLDGSLDVARVSLNANILSGSYSAPIGDFSFDLQGDIKQSNFYIAQISMVRGSNDGASGKYVFTKL
jgi:branched-chain amino acid transport system substrate-binding protein